MKKKKDRNSNEPQNIKERHTFNCRVDRNKQYGFFSKSKTAQTSTHDRIKNFSYKIDLK